MSEASSFADRILSGEGCRFSYQGPNDDRVRVMVVAKGAVPVCHIVPSEIDTGLSLANRQVVALLDAEAGRFAELHAIKTPEGVVVKLPWVLIHGLPELSGRD